MILTLLRRLALRGVPQHRLLKGGLPLLLDSTAVQDLVRKRGSASRREAPTSRDAARRARVTTRIRIRARTRARAITRERARIGAITPVRARMTYWSCSRKSAVSDILGYVTYGPDKSPPGQSRKWGRLKAKVELC